MQTFLEWFWENFPDELLGNSDVEWYDRVAIHNFTSNLLVPRRIAQRGALSASWRTTVAV